MRIRWLPIALGISLLVNVVVAVGWLGQIMSEAVLYTDTGSTFRALRAERVQLVAMRTHFCRDGAVLDRPTLLAWEREFRAPDELSEPYDKDGLLWLRDLGIKFDSSEQLLGICSYMTWQALDNPASSSLDNAGEACPLEPLC